MKRLLHETGEAGFTLVEMLVALTIFAILAAAGVGILRASVDTQAAVDAKLGGIGEIARLHALLASDLGQAVDRPTRGVDGPRPAFLGEAGRIAFVRSGWANLDGEPRATLQRVEWNSAGQQVARIGYRRLDGDDSAVPALFAKEASASFRFRGADGSWSSAYVSSPERPLPAAVELSLSPRRGNAMTIIIALPPIENLPPPTPGAPA